MKQIPNLFTLLNLVFGCLAIIFILQTGQSIVFIDKQGFSSWDLPEKMTWGCICIFAAAMVDFLDGFVARLFKASSLMGKQLDSLADLVSFGVAPGMIMYQLLRLSFGREEGGLDVSMIALLPALLIPCAAAWRLAKFNLDTGQEYLFKGLPSPAVGITIASIPMIIFYQQLNLQEILLNKWLLYGTVIFLSFLMISSLPMLALKFRNLAIKENLPKYILAVLAIIGGVTLGWVAIPVLLLCYVLVSLVFKKASA
jgi:CDP-diacylglycerol---serine O-phosphatidyltransferase